MKADTTFSKELHALGQESLAMAKRLALSSFPGVAPRDQLESLSRQLRERYSSAPHIANICQPPLNHLWAESILDAINGDLLRSGYNRWLLIQFTQGPKTPAQVAATYGIGTFQGQDRSTQRAGGKARQAPLQKVRAFIVSEFEKGGFPSPRQAAFRLAPAALEHARAIGSSMSEQNTHETVYRWILDSRKK